MMNSADTGPFHQLPDLVEIWGSVERPALVVARSAQWGADGDRRAVDGLHRTARGVARHGIELARHLPSDEHLLQLLAQVRLTDRAGNAHTSGFDGVDLRRDCGVYVVLGRGSAHLVDMYRRPFVSHITAAALRLHPSVVFAHRIDLIVRGAWALGPMMLAIEDDWVGDSVHGASGVERIVGYFVTAAREAGGDEAYGS